MQTDTRHRVFAERTAPWRRRQPRRGRWPGVMALVRQCISAYGRRRLGHRLGYTIIEMLLAMGIVGALTGLAVPRVQVYLDQARVAQAIADIAAIQSELLGYHPLPESLAEIGRGGFLDPWGNPYQYLKLSTKTVGQARKDKFLIPLNSDFDLYSMGEDGATVGPLTAEVSQDDVIRANSGGFIGLASRY